MTTHKIEIIVKVGEKSLLSFSHSKAYRVISCDELIKTSKLLTNCNIIIIEHIDENELDDTKSFIEEFTSSNEKNKVWFYTPDNDEITCGLADELCYDIYLDYVKLFEDIYNNTGLNISTNIELRAKIDKDINKDEEDNIFGTIDTEIDSDIKEEIIEGTETPININKDEQSTETSEQLPESSEQSTETSEQLSETTEHSTESIEQSTENIEIELNTDNDSNTENTDESDDIKILVPNTFLDKTNEEDTELSKMLQDANERINELLKLNKALSDKYTTTVEEYKKIVNDDEVIEDPISLQKYMSIQDELDKHKKTVEEANRNIENLHEKITELEEVIKTKDEEITNKLNDINILNEKIKNGEIDSDKIKECNDTIDKLNNEISELNFTIKNNNSDISRLRKNIDEYTELIDSETISRQNTLEFANIAILEFADLIEQLDKIRLEKEQLSQLVKNLESSGQDNSELIESQSLEIAELKKKLDNAEKNIEDTLANERFEKNELLKKYNDIQEQFNFVNEQLKLKEDIIKASGIDTYGLTNMIDNNKALEDINKTLREQIRITQNDIEAIRLEKDEMQKHIKQLDDKNKQLKNNIEALSSSGAGRVLGNSIIPSIRYNSRAKIIPVFGCGSFGITTTAMSIAQKLAQNNSVLYIDFDLVAPKADSWFRKNPICKDVVGFVKSDARYSGLGIFFEQGMKFFADNIRHIIFRIERFKNGNIDYLSGVYSKIDTIKIISGDFTNLMNFLGSNYQYIVIDLGRLGSSELNDSIIKNMTDIAESSVVVTTQDSIEVRNFRIKLSDININMDKIAWLINMHTQPIDEKTKRYIMPANYGIIPFYSNLYGKKETFNKLDKFAKDKFDAFLSTVVTS